MKIVADASGSREEWRDDRRARHVDPATIPFQSGRFAPVRDEIIAGGLSVEGALPIDLTGAYFHYGPNPMFNPLGSFTYPLEGDGILHGVGCSRNSVPVVRCSADP